MDNFKTLMDKCRLAKDDYHNIDEERRKRLVEIKEAKKAYVELATAYAKLDTITSSFYGEDVVDAMNGILDSDFEKDEDFSISDSYGVDNTNELFPLELAIGDSPMEEWCDAMVRILDYVEKAMTIDEE